MTASMLRLLVSGAAAVAVIVAAWAIVRLWRAGGALTRLRDEGRSEDGLRAMAEAVLAARLARGQIDQPTYERLMERLWGLEAGPGPRSAPAAPGTPPTPRALGVEAPADAAAAPRGGGNPSPPR